LAAGDVLGGAAGVDAGVAAGVLGVVGAHNAAARRVDPPALEDVGDVRGVNEDGPARRVDLNGWWTGSRGAKDEHRYALYLRVAKKLFRRRSSDDPFALPSRASRRPRSWSCPRAFHAHQARSCSGCAQHHAAT